MITPTRMELSRIKRKLATATRGHKLLKDKRDELMRQFLEMIHECATLRESVEERLALCNKAFTAARAEMSEEAIGVTTELTETEVETTETVEFPLEKEAESTAKSKKSSSKGKKKSGGSGSKKRTDEGKLQKKGGFEE